MKSTLRYTIFFLCLLLQIPNGFGQITGNELEISKRTAGYIHGFTKYIRWENQDKLPVFSIGVLGNETLLVASLEEIAGKKKVGIAPHKKTIIIKSFTSIEEISGVQMLYVNKRSGFEIEKILEKITGSGTLVVSENYPYQTSMINFIQGGNLQKFEYNRSKIVAENMKIASEIDEFAVISYEDWRNLVKDREGELKKEKETVEKQTEQLFVQEIEIKKKETDLNEKNLEIENKNREIELKKKEIEKQKSESYFLKSETEKLQENILMNTERFEQQKIEMIKQNAEIEKQKANLKELKKESVLLEEQNKEKEATINEKEITISEKESEIAVQRMTIYFGIVTVFLIAGFGFYIFRQYKAKQRINKILEEKNIAIHEQKEQIEQQKRLVDIKNKNITASINYAKRIQQAILISREHLDEIMPEHFIFYRPRDIVSGDFYWAHRTHSGKLIFTAVDCTGHGVPGAFMSMVGNALLNEIVIENNVEEVDEILNQMKKGVIQALKQTGAPGEQKDGMDIALCCLSPAVAHSEENKNTRELFYAGANNPLYHFRDGVFTEYKGEKQTIGYQKGKETPFTKYCIDIQKGDTLYIFTDGLADQKGGAEGRKYYYKTIQELFASIRHLPMTEQRTAVKKAFEDWKGNHEQIDDICVIGIRI